MTSKNESLLNILADARETFAGKGKLLAEYVLASPDKAVFMTTRQLGAAAGVSEATVVRFVRQLGFESYAKFISAIRDLIDRKFTLMERERMSHPVSGSEDKELDRLINQDIADIRAMHKRVDRDQIRTICRILKEAPAVFIMGARLSYSSAHYMGWTMTKIRDQVHILNGSDRTSMDRMVFAPEESVIVIIATSRYPNELIRMGKIARRQKFRQILITDSLSCPLAPLSDHVLIAPLTAIPFLGNPASLVCLIHYLLNSLAAEMGEDLKTHQEKLEQAYRENDIWFN